MWNFFMSLLRRMEVALCLACLCLLVVIVCGYVVLHKKVSDYSDLVFLSQCEMECEVVSHFGRDPDAVWLDKKADSMKWKLPRHAISKKVLFYRKPSKLWFCIYVDDGGRVEYVFSSDESKLLP